MPAKSGAKEAKTLFAVIEKIAETEILKDDYKGLRLMIERDMRGKMQMLTLRVGPEKKIEKRTVKAV